MDVLRFAWGKGETHKQIFQESSGQGRDSRGIIPGQSRENFVYVLGWLKGVSPRVLLALPLDRLDMCFLVYWCHF